MSDEHDAQERVRRLLGAAATPSGGERIPDEVAARLDDALADLVAERTGTGDEPGTAAPLGTEHAPDHAAGPGTDSGTHAATGTVTDLATRRRRRWPQLLVAAAAVSVVGLGVGNLVQNGDGEAASSADQATAEMAEEQEAAGGGAAAQAAPDADVRSRRPDGSPALVNGERPRLRTSSLALDIQRIEDLGLANPVDRGSAEWQESCVRPATGGGDAWLPVRLDGDAAVLVLRAPTGGRRTGDVFACGAAGSPVASVTVEAR